jgi:mevalonate kinase
MPTDTVTQASAPGRIILFGEHGIEHGSPAIALAVDFRARCNVQVSPKFTVNGEDLDSRRHSHLRGAILNGWSDMDTPLAITTDTDIPPELGLGGLAAGMVACLGAISMLHDHIIFEHVARNAFLAHSEVEAGCTPLDSAVSTHGGCVMVSPRTGNDDIWSFNAKNNSWHVSEVRVPEMELVLGYSGMPSPTMEMRNKVLRFSQRNSFARDIISDIGGIVDEGRSALASGDLAEIGRAMNSNHRLLVNLGVSTPIIESMVKAAARNSHGVKITGTGGGGCIVALAREPEKVVSAIESAGGKAFRLAISGDGLRPDD